MCVCVCVCVCGTMHKSTSVFKVDASRLRLCGMGLLWAGTISEFIRYMYTWLVQ